MDENVLNSVTNDENSAIMTDMELNCRTVIKSDGFGKDQSDIPLLQKHCFTDFRFNTLSKISNEYEDELCDQEDDDMDHVSDSVGDNESESSFYTISREKQLRVKCLQSYEDLVRTCETSGLKFVGPDNEHCHKLARQYKLKRCTVNCLETYEELETTCEKLNLKSSISSQMFTYTELYEVDLILDDKIEEGVKYYLIKWKNYELKTSTWEPYYHLTMEEGCKKLVHYYDYLTCSSNNHLQKKMVDHFIQDLVSRRPYDILCLSKLCSLFYGIPVQDFMKLPTYRLRNRAKSILNTPIFLLNKQKGQLLELMQFSEARKHVLIDLQEWKQRINAQNPTTYIEVQNNVDLERAPADFQFIHDYVSQNVPLCNTPVAFCSCYNCYEHKNFCCPHDSDSPFAYNKYGRLQLLPGYPVYECNRLCKCGPDCPNRVVQHGQKIKVAIFRTSNGCGWGLKALETIQKDQFVLEYLGEILTSEDAENRGKVYDCVGRSYLFDLDYGERNCQFTVDAGRLGNSAHFINHSCDPNLHVFAVWINNQDPHLPRLAFFAKRKIHRDEELTFDYKMVKNTERYDSQSPLPEKDRMLCKCNTKKCRKYLF